MKKQFSITKISKYLLYAMLATVLFYSCTNHCEKDNYGYQTNDAKNYIPKSATISYLKNKGVILKKKNGLGEGYALVIQTQNDIVEEQTKEEIYNFLHEGDTIK